MLYRPREMPNEQAWNLPFDITVVADHDIEDAKAEGWMLSAEALAWHANPAPGPYADILDNTAKDIEALLPDMTAAELRDMRAAEAAGKARAGLLTAIDKAIAAQPKD